jgi:hypothetical protein
VNSGNKQPGSSHNKPIQIKEAEESTRGDIHPDSTALKESWKKKQYSKMDE